MIIIGAVSVVMACSVMTGGWMWLFLASYALFLPCRWLPSLLGLAGTATALAALGLHPGYWAGAANGALALLWGVAIVRSDLARTGKSVK